MVEMRFVPPHLSKSKDPEVIVNSDGAGVILQYRYLMPSDDGAGLLRWSDWIDVPTVTDSTV